MSEQDPTLPTDHDLVTRLLGREPAGDFEIVGVVEDTVYTAVQWHDHSMYFIPMMQRFADALARFADGSPGGN